MSDQEKFLARWSRRKLKPADKQAPEESPTAADAPPIESAPPAPKAEAPEFDVSTLPSLDFDRRHVRHTSVPASGGSLRAQACGASARVVGRSGDPRLHRAEREFLGRRGPGGRARIWRTRSHSRREEASRRDVRRGRTGTARGDRNGVASRSIHARRRFRFGRARGERSSARHIAAIHRARHRSSAAAR